MDSSQEDMCSKKICGLKPVDISLETEGEFQKYDHIAFHEITNRLLIQTIYWKYGSKEVGMHAICFKIDNELEIICETEVKLVKHLTKMENLTTPDTYYSLPPSWSEDGSMVLLDAGKKYQDTTQRSRLYTWTIQPKSNQLNFVPTKKKEEDFKSNLGQTDKDKDLETYIYQVTDYRFCDKASNDFEQSKQLLASGSSNEQNKHFLVSGFIDIPVVDNKHVVIDMFTANHEGGIDHMFRVKDFRGYVFLPLSSPIITVDNQWKVYVWHSTQKNSEVQNICVLPQSDDIHVFADDITKDQYPIDTAMSPDGSMVIILQMTEKYKLRLILFHLNVTKGKMEEMGILDEYEVPHRPGPYRYFVAFTPDSSKIAACCNEEGTTHLFDVERLPIMKSISISHPLQCERNVDTPLCGIWCPCCQLTTVKANIDKDYFRIWEDIGKEGKMQYITEHSASLLTGKLMQGKVKIPGLKYSF